MSSHAEPKLLEHRSLKNIGALENEHSAAYEVRSGTSQDDADMHRLGRRQQLNRSFRSISIFGLALMVISSWLVIIVAFQFSVIDGGRAGTIWTLVVACVFMLIVTASLAEMASMAPTSGGQYHWVSELAPGSVQRPLSYISGWLSALGWQTFVAANCFQTGQVILILAEMTFPSYTSTAWQQTLMAMAFGIVGLVINIVASQKLPFLDNCALAFYIASFFAILITLWSTAPLAPASEVFSDFSNFGGWSSVGAACVVGQLTTSSSLVGADSAAHLSEEVRDASLTVPRMMMSVVALSGVLALIMAITMMFVIQDVQSQVVESTAAYPFIEVFIAATGSRRGGIALTVLMIILTIIADVNAMAAASRQAWSFSRDQGLPFSRWFARITLINGQPLPINAMIGSLFVCFVIALLNLGGSEVVDSIGGLALSSICLTYTLSILAVLWRRLTGKLPHARWSLGKFGILINIISVLYLTQLFIIAFFPLFTPVTAKEMNWAIAIFGGIAVLCFVNYAVNARKKYVAPVVHLLRDE